MKKEKIKKYSVIVGAVLLIVIITLYYLIGELGGNSLRVRFNLLLHKKEYVEVMKKFLVQDKLKNIAFNINYDIINNCSNHPDDYVDMHEIWVCDLGNYPNETEIKLENREAVLRYLEIPKEEYLYFANFMQKYHLDGIGKDEEKRYVEITDSLKGLRYYEEENSNDFVTNREYLSVKKIDNHWFIFSTDWN